MNAVQVFDGDGVYRSVAYSAEATTLLGRMEVSGEDAKSKTKAGCKGCIERVDHQRRTFTIWLNEVDSVYRYLKENWQLATSQKREYGGLLIELRAGPLHRFEGCAILQFHHDQALIDDGGDNFRFDVCYDRYEQIP